jgi:phosphodiester glycosidase
MFTIARWVATVVVCGSLSAGAVPGRSGVESESIAPGVDYQAFTVPTSHGRATVHVVTVDLRQPGVRAGLLYPGSVTSRQPVAQMAQAQGVVAAINGDFFDIAEREHPGVPATGAATGPAMADGIALKAAVPQGQRFGLTPPPGGTDEEVFGVGADGVARTARLTLRGHIGTPQGPLPLGGLNQYALPVGAIGVFTPQWGTVSRARAACGTDDYRAAPCTPDTREVTIQDGHIEAASDTVADGPIPPGELVLVGREAGADQLRNLPLGTPVNVDYGLASTSSVPFTFALGAYQLLLDHQPLTGLDTQTAQPRSAVGISDDGHTLRLLSTDGREGTSSGLTLSELADVLDSLDCEEAAYLDGGASATLVTRDPEGGLAIVRNSLDHGHQRKVPNGIAIYASLAPVPPSTSPPAGPPQLPPWVPHLPPTP